MTELSRAAALMLYDLARDEHRAVVDGEVSYGTAAENENAIQILSEAMSALCETMEEVR